MENNRYFCIISLFYLQPLNLSLGRWESTGPELLTIKDRHGRPYVLSPVSSSSRQRKV